MQTKTMFSFFSPRSEWLSQKEIKSTEVKTSEACKDVDETASLYIEHWQEYKLVQPL